MEAEEGGGVSRKSFKKREGAEREIIRNGYLDQGYAAVVS
jgi:hypothetical protein